MLSFPWSVKQKLPLDNFCTIADNIFDLLERHGTSTINHLSRNQQHVENHKRPQSPSSSHSRDHKGYMPYSEGQRPKICRAHIYFAAQARSCTSWCQWPGDKPKRIFSRNSSPASSRASSPVQRSENWFLPLMMRPSMSSLKMAQTPCSLLKFISKTNYKNFLLIPVQRWLLFLSNSQMAWNQPLSNSRQQMVPQSNAMVNQSSTLWFANYAAIFHGIVQ